eukprot:TRINITY_DN19222_c0_g1_i2.p1 TRINITY_DN19222_c0_g1~~TRINITY_DN19222_c0_g1_i2.p1  ORF type:complete len:518 (+),score=48.94 TRINITY_DN19222_c0_g1_i2:132-1685(+)
MSDEQSINTAEDRQGAVGAVVLAGVSTVFHSVGTVFVFWLGHLKWSSGQYSESASVAAPVHVANQSDEFTDSALTGVQIMFWQCLLEGIFMSGVVGVPTMLAYLARKAEDTRAAEMSSGIQLQAAELTLTTSSGEEKRRNSVDTLTSNELKNILVGDAWCDVDEDQISAGEHSLPPMRRRRVTFNHRIEYDPPPPPPIPFENITSRLKRETRPSHRMSTSAFIAAAVLVSSTAVRQVIQEKQRTPMPIQLPPKRAAFLCILYGFARAVSVLGNYMGLASDLGLCSVAILFSSTPMFSMVLRVALLGESFTASHLPGVILMLVGCAMVVMNSPAFTSFVVLIMGGLGGAVAHFFHNVIRTQVHPYFIAVSMTVAGCLSCGIVLLAQGAGSPSGEQWGYIMGLCVCCLLSDTTQAAGSPESPHVPAGFARALAIALALGLQTVVIDQPPATPTSLAAIFTFSATILLEVKRMSTVYLPYLPLSTVPIDEPPELPDTPPEPRPPTPPPPRVRRSARALEV